ncbi:MAG: hypothetical protein RL367_234 [Pseudomonadota bacterium]|jgi:hypothetical protein
MAVVINEFEAVADTGGAPAGAAAGPGGAKDKVKPADLRQPLFRLAMRRARIRAH